jgi:hypothetical protein
MSSAGRLLRTWIVVLAVSAGLSSGQVPPLGPDFVVGEPWVEYHDGGAAVAINPYGQFVVGWNENFGVGAVLAYDRDGNPRGGGGVGGDPIDPYGQRPLHLAAAISDGFIVVRQYWSWDGIDAVLVTSNGSLQWPGFDVAVTAGLANAPRVVTTPSSEFVVVWIDTYSNGGDVSGTSIQARWIEADGTPVDEPLQVNTTTIGDQIVPDLAVGDDRLVIVWQSESSNGTDQSGTSIQARLFDLNGSPLGEDFQVNSHTPLDQAHPAVAMGAGGSFVVAWQSDSSAGDDVDATSVQARRFTADGNPLGPDFQVNTITPGEQNRPGIGVMNGGAFEIAWTSRGTEWSVQRQAFAADGAPTGSQQQVNTTTIGWSFLRSQLSMNRHGDFVVVWDGGWTIRARIFRNTLFADGFETWGPHGLEGWARVHR